MIAQSALLLALFTNISVSSLLQITFRFTETEVDNYASDKAFLTAILSLKLPQKCWKKNLTKLGPLSISALLFVH